jgi:hypothetical protein
VISFQFSIYQKIILYCIFRYAYKYLTFINPTMSGIPDGFGHNIFSRKDFLKLIGAGSLFVGLSASGILNVLKNIKGASAMTGSATSTIQLMLLEQV